MSAKATTHQKLLFSVVIFVLPFLPFSGFLDEKLDDQVSESPSAKSDFAASETFVPDLIAPGTELGIWVWQRKYLSDPWERILMLDFCRSHGIGIIFLQVHFDRTETGDYIFADPQAWNDLLLMANALNIRIEALDGAGNMAFKVNHEDTIARLEAVLAFNAAQPANARLSGFHYDIEPYTTPRWRSGDYQAICIEFLELLSKLRRLVVKADPSLTFSNAIPFWYDDEKFLMEFNGVQKHLSEHIQDISDFVGIMSYRTKMTGENSAAEITSNELAYGTKIGRPVYLSIETVELPDTPQITFYGKSAVDVASAVRELSEALKYNSSFGGVFIHEYSTIRLIGDQWDLSEINY